MHDHGPGGEKIFGRQPNTALAVLQVFFGDTKDAG